MNTKRPLMQQQSGIVSLMVTMIMIFVISLIVIAFAQVTRRTQREALDNQLSTQAYYAAETGVNDAVKVIQNPTNAGAAINSTSCNDFMTNYLNPTVSEKLNSDWSVQYTCLLVDTTPSNLEWQSVIIGQPKVVPVHASAALAQMKLTWQAAQKSTSDPDQFDASNCTPTADSADSLPPQASWGCAYGLLRLDIMQDNGASTATAALDSTRTFYFKPSGSSDLPVTVSSFGGSTERATLAKTTCNSSSQTCTATIKLSGTASTQNYYVRLSAVYNELRSVTLEGSQSSGAAVTFKGAQAIVDSTGRAQDVLRRIEVHIPLTDTDNEPSAALQAAGSICKGVTVTGNTAAASCPSGGPTTGP